MTTWTLSKPAPVADELDDLIASLDAELGKAVKTEKRSAPKAPRKPAAVEPAPFVQQWFPQALVMAATRQTCRCCANVYEQIDGMFLEDMSRNGVKRQVRHDTAQAIPAEYKALPKRQQWTQTEVDYCVICFQDIAPEHYAPHELVRSLPHDPTANQVDDLPTFDETDSIDRVEAQHAIEADPEKARLLNEYLQELNADLAMDRITEAEADRLYDIRIQEVTGGQA
ncbi:MAG: hypothetical protein ACKOX6_00785 [Bdellovibrio sp.]